MAKRRFEENCNKNIRHLKKVKFSEDVSEENYKDSPKNLQKKSMMESQTFGNFGANHGCALSDNPSKAEKAVSALSGVLSTKCGTLTNKIQCAFCHSAEESEVTLPFLLNIPHLFFYHIPFLIKDQLLILTSGYASFNLETKTIGFGGYGSLP